MAGLTNRGSKELLNWGFRTAKPATVRVALVTDATTPNADTATMADLTEIAAGNGYVSGGSLVTTNATGFDVITQHSTSDYGDIQLADVSWVATGGNMPPSGNGALYAVLTDTVIATVAERPIYAYWSLSTARTTGNGETLTLENFSLRLTTA